MSFSFYFYHEAAWRKLMRSFHPQDYLDPTRPIRFVHKFFLLTVICATAWHFDVYGTPREPSLDQLLELSLEELVNYEVITPTKTATRLIDAPGAVTVITHDQIQRSPAQTIPELLRTVAGVNVRWNAMMQTINIRGFGSNPFTNKVLLLIDGIPYNSWNKGGFPQHPGFDFFNLDNVKHIEVVRGPGSALYGENAFNGVINILSLSGDELPKTRAKLFGGDRNTASFTLSHGQTFNDDLSIYASGRVMQSQLPTRLWFDESDADAQAYDLFFKGRYKDLTLSYYRRQDKFDGFEEALNIPDAIFRSIDKVRQTINIASFEYQKRSDSGRWSFETHGSYANRDGAHCASCHARTQSLDSRAASGGHPHRNKSTEDHGYQAFVNAQLGLHAFKHHNLVVGSELRHLDSGDHARELHGRVGSPLQGKKPVTHYTKGALFIQDLWELFDNKLQLVAGLRYDTRTFPRLFGDAVFPRLAAVYKPSAQLVIRAGWAKAARYPSFSELYQNTWFISAETPSGVIPLSSFIANPDLKPEELETIELGFQYEYSPQLQFKLDLYQNHIDHSIVIAYPRFRYENHPNDVRTRGFEIEVRAEPFDNLSTFANWSYQDDDQSGSGRDSAGNRIEFSYAPKHKFNIGATFTPIRGFTATFDLSWRDEYLAPSFWYMFAFPTNPRVRPLDDYALLNIALSYVLPLGDSRGNKPWRVSFYAKNLLDEEPYETLNGVDGRIAGREFFLSLEYTWSR